MTKRQPAADSQEEDGPTVLQLRGNEFRQPPEELGAVPSPVAPSGENTARMTLIASSETEHWAQVSHTQMSVP